MPSTDLGDVGTQQSEAVNFDWKWSYTAPGLVIWLVLILAIVLPKANHNARILLIFVPLIIVNLFWLGFQKASGMRSSNAYEFSIIFHSISVGITVLWLVVNYFNRIGGFARFFMSFVTIVTVAYLGTFSHSTEFSNETVLFSALFAFMAVTMLCAMTIAGKLCSRKYSPLKFMLWMALYTLVGSLITMFGFFIVATAIMSSGPGPDILEAILMVLLVGLIFGLFLYVINLPFMILAFCSPFFRERFYACLRLKSMPTNATQSNTNLSYENQSPEQNNPKESSPT